MSEVSKIRKNIVTNQWEHWSPEFEYWSPGLYGNNNLNVQEFEYNINEFNSNGDLLSYEDISYKDYQLNLYKETEKHNVYEKLYDTSISELVDEDILSPTFEQTIKEILNTDIIKVLIDTELNFIIAAYNPLTNDASGLSYIWNIGNIEKVYVSNETDIIINSSEQQGELNCIIKNSYGQVENEPISIQVFDPIPSGFFGRNIIKNSSGIDGFENWNIVTGAPILLPLYHDESHYGLFNNNFSVSPYALVPNYNPDEALGICGGSSLDGKRTSKVSQLIDLNDISEVIDKLYNGTKDINGVFYGYLGTWGNSQETYFGLYDDKKLTYDNQGRPVNLDIVSQDKVSVKLTLLDNLKNDIGTQYQLDSTIHEGAPKFYLDYQILSNIPIGTRYFRIDIIFEKSGLIQQYWNLRYWENNGTTYSNNIPDYSSLINAFNKDHLTSVLYLNLKLDINDRYLNPERVIFNGLTDIEDLADTTTKIFYDDKDEIEIPTIPEIHHGTIL